VIKIKPKYINLYMDWAARAAELSHARRLHVGAVVVKDDTVISYGYNGMPAGWDNNCEEECLHENGSTTLTTRPEVLHAESNAVAKLARSNNSGRDADIFITHAPCLDCAKLIYQSGIRRVWYGTAYRDNSGVEFLQQSGIEVTQHDNTTL
jgi:dCMP deaminase